MILPIDSKLKEQRRALTKLWLRSRLILGAGVAAVVLAGALMAGYSWYVKSAEEGRRDAMDRAVTQAAADFSRRWSEKRQALGAGIDNDAVVALLASGTPAAIAAKAAELKAADSETRQVWVLPTGTNQVDRSTTPPLGYAALDMLRHGEASGEAAGPALLLAGDNRHVAVPWVLTNAEGETAGHVLFALPPKVVTAVARGIDLRGGYGEIQQPVTKGAPQVLVPIGDASQRGGAPSHQLPLKGTPWRLVVWDGSGVAQESAEVGNALLPISAVVLVLAVGAIGYRQWRRRKLAAPVLGGAAAEAKANARSERPAVPLVDDAGPALEGGDVSADMPELNLPDLADLIETEEHEREDTGAPAEISASIFRVDCVRGVAGKTITPDIVRELGRAIGSEAYDRGQQTIVVAADGRLSSPELQEAVIAGLRSTGRDVIDIGQVPTPVLYFATHYLETASGVMVTGSHHGPDINGLKVVLGGETLHGSALAGLRGRVESGDLLSGEGSVQTMEVVDEYVRRISEDIPVSLGSTLKVVVDCGNGIAGAVAPKVIRALGHDVIELYCEVDGNFPNHYPDPSQPENYRGLADAMAENGADMGLAFDGDGDRLGVADAEGKVIWPDRQMMLYARDVLSRNAGAEIVFDVQSSRYLGQVINKLGGKPVMWRSGHAFIKEKMHQCNAPLGGELSGHICFKDRWYGFDDAIYAAARLLEILVALKRKPNEVFAALPGGAATPELRVEMAEGAAEALLTQLAEMGGFEEGKVSTVDGMRVDFPDGWGVVRASTTSPALVLRFEGQDVKALKRIQGVFKEVLLGVDIGLPLPF